MPDAVAYPEKRAASPTVDTASVPGGTMLTVPSATPTGPSPVGPAGPAPVVAVNTTHWYADAAFMSAVGGAALALAEPLIQALQAKGPINWRSLALGCVLAIVAYLRNRNNTVIR